MIQAIDSYELERLKTLEREAKPVANLGAIVARLGGVKNPDTAWVNEYELVNRKIEINKLFSPEVAKFYVDLHKRKIIPGWVDELTDLDKMKLAAL